MGFQREDFLGSLGEWVRGWEEAEGRKGRRGKSRREGTQDWPGKGRGHEMGHEKRGDMDPTT